MSEIATETDEAEFEDESRIREISKLEYEERKQEVSDRLRFQVEFGQALLKSLLLVNGASVISLLTFIGNSDARPDPTMMWWSFSSFAAGIVLALAAYFGAFFSQMNFMQTAAMQMWASHGRAHGIVEVVDESEVRQYFRKGTIAINVAIFGAALSVGSFIGGAFFALKAIL